MIILASNIYSNSVSNGNYIGPFCNANIPLYDNTHREEQCYFNVDVPHFVTEDFVNTGIINVHMYYCPQCKKVSFVAVGDSILSDIVVPIYPISNARQFPEYIPKNIREDYEEAYSIINLSPKASATLSRRCLQGMIRDFWKISKSRLIDEINALQDKIPTAQWNAINSLRSIGNIGAHMEKDVNVVVDVDPYEAERLLKLIELLLEKWYIARHDEEQLLTDIPNIAKDKKSLKSK